MEGCNIWHLSLLCEFQWLLSFPGERDPWFSTNKDTWQIKRMQAFVYHYKLCGHPSSIIKPRSSFHDFPDSHHFRRCRELTGLKRERARSLCSPVVCVWCTTLHFFPTTQVRKCICCLHSVEPCIICGLFFFFCFFESSGWVWIPTGKTSSSHSLWKKIYLKPVPCNGTLWHSWGRLPISTGDRR